MSIVFALVTAVAVTQISNLVTTVYLHRALAHKALTLHPIMAWTCKLVLWLSTGMKAREWVAVHRKHHAYTDTVQDPHSPKIYGWLKVQLANAAMYRRVARTKGTVEKYARDLPRDRWDRFVFDRAFVGLGLGIAMLIWIFGPWLGVVAAVVHMAFYLGIGGAVNGIGHHFGRRPYDNSATNLHWLAMVSGGEGYHNNHHAAPTSARLSLHRGEVDFGWWAIKLASLIGLAKVRLETPKLKRT